ncbi:MAG TPA: DUF3649 domain-containing protein [Hyphomicrobiales bacterium]|nr:DUF3649 domain-containing protein [Hyphomicrobiales bacterium]
MQAVTRHRWSVASRSLAAIIGGYALANVITIAASLVLHALGLSLAPVVLGNMLASFLVWAVIIMAVFHARSAAHAWLWLAGSALPLGVIVWCLLP